MGTLPKTFFSLLTLSIFLLHGALAQVDLTSANRRPPIPGLPDWSGAGFENGVRPLPADADVKTIITADQVRNQYGIIPDDGKDDTDAFQNMVTSVNSVPGNYVLIQLPAGVINLSHSIYLDKSYLIIRGASNDPDTGTRLVFAPDENTKYDKLNADGSRWDLEAMSYSWEYTDPTRPGGCGPGSGCGLIRGSATSGWIWPGRSIFRISSRRIATKFQTPYDMAPANRKDFFLGSINYHWSIDDGKVKGYEALQTLEKPGVMGTNRVYVDNSTDFEFYGLATDVWIGSPVKANDYRAWGVEHDDYFVNSYVFQDWFTITHRDTDEIGNYLELDHDLRFDVYANSVADGSEQMEDQTTFAKVMPILDKITNVGIENLYMTQSMPGMDPQQAVHNYGNLAPESAMHGIVFRFAQNCWVRNIRTFMTGSHPIATEDAKNIQIQDNFFDGAWNKGAGGNGYLRGSRVWDSVYFNNTLRNLRHITMQWSSMGNVVIMNNITNDMNLHGGYEGYNLFELNYVSIPYEHRAGACTSNCGGEGGSTEGGTWFPIYWSTGDKASKWSGASGPQNVFYRNYMLKAMTPGADQTEYLPYWSRDGSLSDTIWQFGWDRDTPEGDHYQHLTKGPLRGDGLLLDWQGHEQDDFAHEPGFGVNGLRHDKFTSLFLRDVSGASGVPSFSSIAGFAYCRGKVQPKVVGYYLGASATGSCLQADPETIDSSAYTHVLYAYASVAADGTASITSAQNDQIQKIKGLGDGVKVYLAVGGYGLGADPTPMQKAAVNSGGARTKLANSLASVCTSFGIDGVDLEWATGVTAAQFTTIATTVKTALGSRGVSLSVSSDFWSLSGVNKVTTTLRDTVDFISLWTHAGAPGSALTYPHSVAAITDIVSTAQKAGMFPDLLLMPVTFYGRSYKLSGSDCDGEGCGVSGPGSTSQCIAPGGFQQSTYPYYALDSILNGGNYDDASKMGDTWVDDDEYYRVLQLSDGSIVEFDVPASVTNKVGSAIDLCMGGISVFSIDQDTYTASLETAIWDVGAMSPSAEDIALAVSGSAITDNGDADESFWDSATSTLSVQYPWLPAVSVYRVFVFIALRAQQQIAARLRNYLQFSDFATDNFALYQKWETKAADWALANATGYGRQYWTCSSSENGKYTSNDCPHVFEQNNKDQAFPNVYWKLADHDGFRKLINDTFSLDIDQLIVDKIDVAMADVFCLNTAGSKRGENQTINVPEGVSSRSPEMIKVLERETVSAAHVKRQSQLQGPSPYDPDPDCKSTWHGVYQVNGTALFTNPAETLSTWIDAYENAATTMYAWNSRQDVTPSTLGSLLESILTNIAIGSSSIQSTQQYIDQVRFDKELQKEFDAFKAQQSGLQMFLDIGLSILSLIPGIGDGALVASAVIKAVNVIGDAIKVGRITNIVAETSGITRIIEAGIATEKEASNIGRAVDGLLDSKTLETRGKIGKSFDKNNKVMRQCLQEGVQILMDANDLAQPFYFPDAGAAAKRELEWEPSAAPEENVPHGLDELLSMDHLFGELESPPRPTNSSVYSELVRKAKGANTKKCVWTMNNAEELKGFGYEKHCKDSKNKMTWNIARDGSTDVWKETTYAECKDVDPANPPHPLFDKAMCACDHILEALEVVAALVPSWLDGDANKSRREDLCAEFPDLTDAIRKALNSADNMEGLWGLSNTIKSSMLDARRLQDVAHIEISSLTSAERSMELEIAVEHTEGYASRRVKVAQAIDAAITAADFPGASADWKKLYSPGMMDAERARSDARFSDKLLKTSDILVDPVTGNPDAHQQKGKKRPATGNINPSCKKKKTKP